MNEIYQQQFAQTISLLEGIKAGEPAWIILEAPFGQGKTTFLQRLTQTMMHHEKYRLIEVRGLSRNLPPYWGAIRLFEELTKKKRQPWHHARKWSDTIAQIVSAIPIIGNFIAAIISAGKVIAEEREMSLRERFIRPDPIAYEVDQAIIEALDHLNLKQPLLITFDDIHLLDPASIAVIRTVITAARGRVGGILALESGASDESDAIIALARETDQQHIFAYALPALARDDIRLLASNFLGAQRIEPLLDEYLIELSGGNPWLLKTLIHELLEQKTVVVEQGYAQPVGSLPTNDVGPSIRRLFERRLRQLDAVSLASARKAALVGPIFPARLVRMLLSSLPGETVLSALKHLEDEDMLMTVQGQSNVVWAFISHVLWELLHNEAEALEEDSEDIHRAIIAEVHKHPEYKEIIDLSYHYEQAHLFSAAASQALADAKQAMNLENYGRAAQLLDRAVRCAMHSGDRRVELAAQIALVTVYRSLGKYAESAQIAESLEMHNDLTDAERAEVLLEHAQVQAHVGAWDDAIALGTQSYTLAQRAHLPLLEILGRNAMNTAGGLGPWQPEVFRASAQRAKEIGEPILAAQSRGLEAQGDLFDGRPAHAKEILEHLRKDDDFMSYPPDRHIVLNNLAIANSLLERHAEGFAVFEELMTSASRSRDRWGYAVAYVNRAAAQIRAGASEAGISDGQMAIILLNDIHSTIGEPYLNFGVAQALQDIQQLGIIGDGAQAALQQAQLAARPYWRIWERGSLRLNLARLAYLQQDFARVTTLLNELIAEPGRYTYRLVEATYIARRLPPAQQSFVQLPQDIDGIIAAYPELQATLFQRDPLACTGHFICRGWAL